MRIVRLTAENVKRLKAVDITPEGDVVIVAGRNAQGKSSVLDSIWMALAGAAGAKETSMPVREGEEKAHVRLDLGDLIVLRKWTASGTTLEVSTVDIEDGHGNASLARKYASPQAVLDSLIGLLSFDPLAFASQDAKGQRATLLSVVELPFDPDALDAERKELFDRRTDVNRETRTLAAQSVGLDEVPEGTPDEEVSSAALADELSAAMESNGQRAELLGAVAPLSDALDRAVATVEVARLALDDAVRLEKEARANLNRASKAMEKAPAPVDVDEIRARIASVDSTNAAVRLQAEHDRIDHLHEASREEGEALTAQIEAIDKRKQDGIEQADMPLEGLSFDEDGVLYQGVPFGQCSASERLRVGVAVAMAVNPKIRVIRIADGSLLDSENMAMIEQLAADHDFQVWIERVDESGKVGVVIEDGQVAS